MKKIGIVTICDPLPNYGNRLQNYAVQKVLNDLGFDSTTYSFEGKTIPFKDRIKHFIHQLTHYRLTKDKFLWTYGYRKRIAFKDFNDRFLKIKTVNKITDSLQREQDYFVVGSDQVWNPTWYGNSILKKEAFLLTFAKPEQKLCFSPSFGIEELPQEWKDWFKKQLCLFPALNVREEAGVRLIKNLLNIDKDIEVLIDPTMMLSSDEWLEISCEPKGINCSEPYIFTYFVGDLNTDANAFIEEHMNDYKVYSINDRNQPDLYSLGPSQFIYMISKASIVLTDSFHACVFSILFRIPFLVFSQKGKENTLTSRIDTLLETFQLHDRYVDKEVVKNPFEINYIDVEKILNSERKKVIDYFKYTIN